MIRPHGASFDEGFELTQRKFPIEPDFELA
jgi:hypothetical protein